MNAWQVMLEDFHSEVMRDPEGPEKPTVLSEYEAVLRRHLILEESGELCRALETGDMVEIADGMIDLIYVVVGTAVRMGIDLDPLFYEVHASNMAKADGPLREDGKRLKPPGWTPPNIRAVLESQGWQG